MANLTHTPLVRRDIEAAYAPKLITLPDSPTAYLLLFVAAGATVCSGGLLMGLGLALIAWEGYSHNEIDRDKLTEQESYLLELLDDQHPRTGETLNKVMRDVVAKCNGDRAIPSQVMASVIEKAYFDQAKDCYLVDDGTNLMHVSSYAERYFCQLFAENTGRRLSPANDAPALGASVAPALPIGANTMLNAVEVSAALDLEGLFDVI